MKTIKNIGFVSTRISGTDGVSLEISKWATVLENAGYKCFYCAGELDTEPSCSHLVPEASFNNPEIEKIQNSIIINKERDPLVSSSVDKIKREIKDELYRFLNNYRIELLIAENCLAIPMNIPLGLALTEVIIETGIPAIAHHHDFFWERERFLNNQAADYFSAAFPPPVQSMAHVTINSIAAENLAFRTGLSSRTIPNVFDFESPPEPLLEEHRLSIRRKLGIAEKDPFILQPTRVVPRKSIERSIDLVSSLGMQDPTLVISHESGDEGGEYKKMLQGYAGIRGVKLIHTTDLSNNADALISSLSNLYQACDFVTYPSSYEGFGNAFLEALYFRCPVLINRYPVFIKDIEPLGFDLVVMDTFITETIIEKVKRILIDKKLRTSITDQNYKRALEYFSFSKLKESLELCINDALVHKRKII